jgi:hypothetical protein
MYAGDFGTATAEAKRVLSRDSAFHTAYLPLAIGALAPGDIAAARRAYEGMARTGASGASLAALGGVDIALYQGYSEEAVKLLTNACGDRGQETSPPATGTR